MVQSICVFCGSSLGNREGYRTAATELGSILASRGIRLVYGGANVGLMKTLADACLAAGGKVIGVIPQALVDKEIAHRELTELHIVRSMHERKALMADVSEAFIALPGGFGTLEEFLEVATWTQMGLQRKPSGLVNVDGYYDGLLRQADRAVQDGFLKPGHRAMLLADPSPAVLLDLVSTYKLPILDKWVTRTER
jgi:uncharacterized protein (TIGR00730 family)